MSVTMWSRTRVGWRRSLVCAIGSLALVLSACAPAAKHSIATAPGGLHPPGAAVRLSQPAAPAGVYQTLLGLIPDTPATRGEVTMTDFARIRDLFGVATPADPADPAQREAYFAQLAATRARGIFPTFLSELGTFAQQTNLAAYLGYRRVDQDVSAGQPPSTFEAVRGVFDPDAAAAALAACADCPPAQTAQFEGVTYYSWGDDFAVDLQSVLKPPAFDRLGRGGRIAVTNEYILRTLWTEGMTAMIAAAHGSASLGANADFRLAAQGLEDLQTYGAYLTDQTQTATAETSGPLLRPYSLIAVGVGREANGAAFTGIALVHESEQAAQGNAGLIQRRIGETSSAATRQPWSSMFSSVEVHATGRLLAITLHGSAIGPDFLLRRDPLLAHE